MILGIGTDIVRIDRIEGALSRLGDAFARRILTGYELSLWLERSSSAAWLAKRFAAKEAAAKAFGTGIGELSFQHIEVRNHPSGAPELLLYGYALDLQHQREIKRLHISLSDERDYAMALVVLES